jgi:hypothetical protein
MYIHFTETAWALLMLVAQPTVHMLQDLGHLPLLAGLARPRNNPRGNPSMLYIYKCCTCFADPGGLTHSPHMAFIGSVGWCDDPGSDLFMYIHSESITCAYQLCRNLGLLPLLAGSIGPRSGPLHVHMSSQVLHMLCRCLMPNPQPACGIHCLSRTLDTSPSSQAHLDL